MEIIFRKTTGFHLVRTGGILRFLDTVNCTLLFSEQFCLVTFSLKCLCSTTLANYDNLFASSGVFGIVQGKCDVEHEMKKTIMI